MRPSIELRHLHSYGYKIPRAVWMDHNSKHTYFDFQMQARLALLRHDVSKAWEESPTDSQIDRC